MNRYVQYMYSYPHKTAYRPLQHVNLGDYMGNLEGEGHSLYLHLHFCESKCGYCNLFSVAGCDQALVEEYLEAVRRQVLQYREVLPGSTVFGDFTIGGGTPLLLSEGQLDRVFQMVRSMLPLGKEAQVVIETAPRQTCREKVALLKKLGVTRVSLGIQSFAGEELAWLGRRHDPAQARRAAGLLMEAGFACVNFDFIYGLPGQTAGSLLESLETAVAYAPEEIFLYPLYIKHGVRMEQEGKGNVLDPEHTYALYRAGSACLKENGYVQVSMRRVQRRSARNPRPGTVLCECGLSGALSLGCGGRSYLGPLHTCTPYRITRREALEEIRQFGRREDFLAATHGILLSEEEMRRRYVIRHLLIRPGISKEAYRKAFGRELAEDFPVLGEWMERGWIAEGNQDAEGNRGAEGNQDVEENRGAEGNRGREGKEASLYSLTKEGLGLSDYIGPMLISEDIRDRMLEWEREHGQKDHTLQGGLEKL